MSKDAMSGDYDHVLQTAMFWTDDTEDEDWNDEPEEEYDDEYDDDEE
jgi:hypothetical protein